MTAALDIFLNDTRAGLLTQLPDGRVVFTFDETYSNDPGRIKKESDEVRAL